MKKYIEPPRMSLNFSETKKDIKKRLSNILNNSGKCKGIVAFLIVLVFIAIIGVFVTVSHDGADLIKNDDKTVFATRYELGKEAKIDLDGDGNSETVYYGLDDFKVNGVSYRTEIESRVYEDSPYEDYFMIADVSDTDGQKEIVLRVDGPSDDPQGHFYTYKNNRLEYLGSVPSNLDVDAFDGKGEISGFLRLNVLQTWWAPAKWGFDLNGNIALKVQDIYYPVQPQEGYELVLKESLPVHESLTDSKQSIMMSPQKVKITETDNKQFCFVEAEDGTSGWFEVYDFFKIKELDGKIATDVFENLCMAD